MTRHSHYALAALVTFIAAPLPAQTVTTLTVGRSLDGHLVHGDTVRYSLLLGARQFVYGEANQRTVDLVVTVIAPDGRTIESFDGPARGPEPFQFTAAEAGTYRIQITPFQQETGDYSLAVRAIQPAATTPEGRVDQLMLRYTGNDRPGGVVAVTRGGRIVFQRAYGMANLEDSTPNTPATIYHVASLSKQFTAFAIALLADQGKLSLDDDVRRYLPNVPDFGTTITLRHLLNHTSGLRDQWDLWTMAGGRLDDVIRQQDLLRLVERQRELNFAPGSEYLYSNTGFMLLSEVVAKVSGVPFPRFMHDNVFAPLGMNATQVYDDAERLVAGRAYSYQDGADGVRKSVLSYANMGATSLFTTAGDLALWLRNWHTGQVGGPRVLAMMQQRGVLTRGDTISYALGIGVDRWRGQARISHGGADAGYRSYISYLPDLDAGVIVLSNSASFNSAGIATQTAEAFFAADLAPAEPPRAQPQPQASPAATPAWTPDSAALAAFTGRYFSDELETMYTLTIVNGQLVAHHRRNGDIPLRPAARDAFDGIQFGRVVFERDGSGIVTGFRVSSGRVRNLLFRRVSWPGS